MIKRFALVALLTTTTLAAAQTDPPASAPAVPATPTALNPQAEALNDQGKTLFSDKKDYAGAADKFQQAIAIQPEARYFYNLCYALEKLESYDKAVQACDAVYEHNPPPALGDKAGQKSAEIRQTMQAKGQTAPPPNPNVPPPSSQPTTAPPAAPVPVDDDYKWSVGGDVGLAVRGGLSDSLSSVGVGGHLYASVIVASKLRLGLQGMVSAQDFGGKNNTDGLLLNDYGLAIYDHIRIAHHLYLTPLVGANVSFQAPNSSTNLVFISAGIRARLSLDILLNSTDVITFGLPDFANYFSSSKLVGDTPGTTGLEGGRTFMFTIGYTRRSTKSLTAADWGLE